MASYLNLLSRSGRNKREGTRLCESWGNRLRFAHPTPGAGERRENSEGFDRPRNRGERRRQGAGLLRDALELEQIGEQPMPRGRMYRLLCGTTHLKIINFDKTPSGKAAPGGPMEATGLRYLRSTSPTSRA